MFVTVADRSRRLYVARFSVRFSVVGGETFCAREHPRGGVRDGFALRGWGETRETPRTAHAPVGFSQLVGFNLNRRRQDHPSLP